MIRFFFVSLFCFVTGVLAYFWFFPNPIEVMYDKIEKKVYKEYGFIPMLRGISMPGGPIRAIDIGFDYDRYLSENEARFYLVSTLGIALETINGLKEIQSELAHRPFKVENIDITLCPESNFSRRLESGDYVTFVARYGNIFYIPIGINKPSDFAKKKTETFEEALKILKEQGRLPEYFQENGKSNN